MQGGAHTERVELDLNPRSLGEKSLSFQADRPRCADKEDVVHMNDSMLLSNKKAWNLAICDNIDGPRGPIAK